MLCIVEVTLESAGEQMFDIVGSGQSLPANDRYQVGIPEHAPGNTGDITCPGDHIPDPVPDTRPARVGRRDRQGYWFSVRSAGAATEDFLDR